jgi:thiosulfate/3-mercaptopyruvate sulfurtransferase
MTRTKQNAMPVLVVAVGLVAALTSGAADRPAVLLAQAPEFLVSTGWVAGRIGDPSVVVIATGTRLSYEAGHIPGARFVGHDELIGADHRLSAPGPLTEALVRAGATDQARIVLYGDRPMETGWLYMALASIGHGDHVSLLDGNINAWRQDGHPVSVDAVPPARGRLTVRPAPDVVVEAPWVRDRLNTSGVKVIDARTTREWDLGRLPGATLVLWQDLFTSLETHRFKSRDEIRALLARAGAGPSDQVATYCAIGMRASLMYLAARYAGYDARVYVGSWQDWQQRSGYPIVR